MEISRSTAHSARCIFPKTGLNSSRLQIRLCLPRWHSPYLVTSNCRCLLPIHKADELHILRESVEAACYAPQPPRVSTPLYRGGHHNLRGMCYGMRRSGVNLRIFGQILTQLLQIHAGTRRLWATTLCARAGRCAGHWLYFRGGKKRRSLLLQPLQLLDSWTLCFKSIYLMR